jgi:hypothetical protein
MTIDLDSTICEVHYYAEQGAAYGFSRQLDYPRRWPAGLGVAVYSTRGCGRVQRKRNAAPGRFLEELIACIRRNGATGPLCVRADSGASPGRPSTF